MCLKLSISHQSIVIYSASISFLCRWTERASRVEKELTGRQHRLAERGSTETKAICWRCEWLQEWMRGEIAGNIEGSREALQVIWSNHHNFHVFFHTRFPIFSVVVKNDEVNESHVTCLMKRNWICYFHSSLIFHLQASPMWRSANLVLVRQGEKSLSQQCQAVLGHNRPKNCTNDKQRAIYWADNKDSRQKGSSSELQRQGVG